MKIISFYIKIIKEKIGLKNINLLSGTAMATIPQTAFIAQKLNLPMVFVRDSKKGHGKQNQIEGVVKRGQKVLVIEDHVSTGGSTVGNVKAIRDTGGRVKYAIATTTYLMKKAQESFNEDKVKVFYLTDFNKIIDVAVKQKYIKPKDKELVLEWAKDPSGWGKKFGFEK
jgi:orotate phosphoribosyltransferase